jgi:hypothetical protein
MPQVLTANIRKLARVGLFALLALGIVILLARENSVRSSEPSALSPDINPPVGTIMAWAGQRNTIPANWRLCNGDELERSQFPQLFNAIGTVWGGTATTRFRLPNLNGRFLRGVDNGAGLDPGDNRTPLGTAPANDVGSVQPEDFMSHDHPINDPGHSHRFDAFRVDGAGGPGQAFPRDSNPFSTSTDRTNITVLPRGGTETRPDNASVYWIIRVR